MCDETPLTFTKPPEEVASTMRQQQQQDEDDRSTSTKDFRRRRVVDFSIPEDCCKDDKSTTEPEEVVAKPAGSLYSKREYMFVLLTGIFMAFNNGYVNGSCLSGFLVPSGRKQAASSMTIIMSQSALALADGE